MDIKRRYGKNYTNMIYEVRRREKSGKERKKRIRQSLLMTNIYNSLKNKHYAYKSKMKRKEGEKERIRIYSREIGVFGKSA